MLKRRHLYVLLYAVPALLVSIVAAAILLAASAGALWLFVFGDDLASHHRYGAWNGLPPGGVALWLALLSVAYAVGRHQEDRPTVNTGHVVFSIGATIVLVAVMAARLMGPNRFGARSDSLVCADYCQAWGFAASGTPPQNSGERTCSCYDVQGREVRRVPVAEATR